MKTFKLKMRKEDTFASLLRQCKELFPVCAWDYSDCGGNVNDRNSDYEIEFSYHIEPDKDLKNLSADALKTKFPNDKFITLPERLKMELKYFEKTGKHLDIKNATLCAGSRYLDGSVPEVFWYLVGLFVSWYDPCDSDSHLRSRRAVKYKAKLERKVKYE